MINTDLMASVLARTLAFQLGRPSELGEAQWALVEVMVVVFAEDSLVVLDLRHATSVADQTTMLGTVRPRP